MPRSPICSFEDANDYVLDAQWSPVHPALFAAADASGGLNLWNINEDMEVPIVRTISGTRAVNKIRYSLL